MSLFQKLVAFMVLATVAPLLLLGAILTSRAEAALQERIVASQRQSAANQAQAAADFINDRVFALARAAALFDLSAASAPELLGAARVLYRASPDVAAVVLLNSAGAPTAPAVYLETPGVSAELAAHPAGSKAGTARLTAELPMEKALAEGRGAVVLSEVYLVPERQVTAIAVALPLPGPNGLLVMGVELTLRSLQSRAVTSTANGKVTLLDGKSRVIADSDAEALGVTDKEDLTGLLVTGPQKVPVPGLDWNVRVSLPRAVAFASVHEMRRSIGLASVLALLLLLGLGAFFTAQIRRGLNVVVAGARAMGQGDLSLRITPPSESELANLAQTFNQMGTDLGAARTKLERWNEELEQQVEIRTAQLKEAQARLLRTQKLAAVGQLGAGVAHEVNNPLASVLGFVQLLAGRYKKRGAAPDDADLKLLSKVEASAKRCQDVTQTLLRFSQQSDVRKIENVAVSGVIQDALTMVKNGFDDDKIEVHVDVSPGDLMFNVDPSQMAQALVHLFANTRTALHDAATESGSKAIRIVATTTDATVRLAITDNGCGIPEKMLSKVFDPFFTTKAQWDSLGLGLSVTQRIVTDHGGDIVLTSEEGEWTTATLTLPSAA